MIIVSNICIYISNYLIYLSLSIACSLTLLPACPSCLCTPRQLTNFHTCLYCTYACLTFYPQASYLFANLLTYMLTCLHDFMRCHNYSPPYQLTCLLVFTPYTCSLVVHLSTCFYRLPSYSRPYQRAYQSSSFRLPVY